MGCGTVCSHKIDPSFFDCLPLLTELKSEMDITEPPAFTETSFLDNTLFYSRFRAYTLP